MLAMYVQGDAGTVFAHYNMHLRSGQNISPTHIYTSYRSQNRRTYIDYNVTRTG